ncbi:hypothetical protein AAFF_G00235340 [Aldrovandia affinis]|uniref:Uncharacterized protein n=1 Tax=Aldrovandia affinis TaxID=143900 RepID=A0AAD7SV55_9TELE|nr:hypothetical protein AAFF_G00235340 [Aldrovandia affinis]
MSHIEHARAYGYFSPREEPRQRCVPGSCQGGDVFVVRIENSTPVLLNWQVHHRELCSAAIWIPNKKASWPDQEGMGRGQSVVGSCCHFDRASLDAPVLVRDGEPGLL